MTFLEIENCTKRFSGLVALNEVSFSVQSGEIIGLIGPNGSGKTTLFNVISGIYEPEMGEVVFNGNNIESMKPYKISRLGIGRTFQIPRPFGNVTVLHNVLVGTIMYSKASKDARNKAIEILTFLGMQEKMGVVANTLTIGDRKKLEIAKALATNPKLILLDEVMGGLTLPEVDEILGLIRKINNNGTTIILIEHIMKAIMNISNRVVVLNYGVKIAEGTPEEIASDDTVIKAYLGEEYVLSKN